MVYVLNTEVKEVSMTEYDIILLHFDSLWFKQRTSKRLQKKWWFLLSDNTIYKILLEVVIYSCGHYMIRSKICSILLDLYKMSSKSMTSSII